MADKVSITICGDGGTGKSAITLRLVRSEWMDEYDPTIEDCYSVTRTISGTPYLLSLIDTAGQEEYRGLWASTNLQSDAFLLVYDITNRNSLHALDYFVSMLAMEAEQREENNFRLRRDLGAAAKGVDVGMPPPVVIVAGNKCDLSDKGLREVSAKEGLEFARGHGCGFMETSARDMVNIEETFELIVRRVVEARQQHYGHVSSEQDDTGPGASHPKTQTQGKGNHNKEAARNGTGKKRSTSRRYSRFSRLFRRRKSVVAEQQQQGPPKTVTATETKRASVALSEKSKGLWGRLRCW